MSDPYQDIARAHGLELTGDTVADRFTPDEFLSKILLLEACAPEVDVRQRVAEVIWPQPSRWERIRRAVLR